ncbi:MAG: hypothetical protein ACRBK7_24130 [Acidimicrobiales bacterium]
MSKQQSKKTQLQRFSGPELSELLELVASEHGPTAAISAVNRVRSGGVGGFFCREEFEVIVDLRNSQAASDIISSTQASGAPASDPATSSAPASAAPAAETPKTPKTPKSSAAPAAQTPGPSETIDANSPPPITPTIDLASSVPVAQTGLIQPPTPPQTDPAVVGETEGDSAQLQRQQQLVAEDGFGPAGGVDGTIDLSDRTAVNGEAAKVFGGPRPQAIDGTHAGFMALLQRRLDDAPPEDSPLAGRRSPQVPAAKAGPPSVDQTSQPVIPAPAVEALAIPEPESFSLLEPEPDEPSGFWRRLRDTEAELAGFMPVSSDFVATIGPLSLITPIVRRLRTQPGMESADVVVLTDRTEIVSEPQWELVRSGNQLVEEAEKRGDRPTILVIDVPVELPHWVAPLQNRLRMAGVGLSRYAVPGDPTAEKLGQYRLASDVPYVLDLISRVSPENLVDFVAQRHPISSVSGAELTAELLLAMRKQVGLGL